MILPIIQARMGSTRWPGKMVHELDGLSLISHVLEHTKEAFPRETIILATSTDPRNDALQTIAEGYQCRIVRGPEDNVLQRFLTATYHHTPYDIVVRITGDDGLKIPQLMRLAVKHVEAGHRYADTNHGPVCGAGAEAFTVELLREQDASDPVLQEHVTPFMRVLYPTNIDLSLDVPEDVARWETYR